VIRETFAVGPLRCNCTILGDETSHDAMVVDPGDEIVRILAVVAKHGLTVKQIVITHAHIDHIAGAQKLKELTGAPIFLHPGDLMQLAIMADQAAWLGVPVPDVRKPDGELVDGATVGVEGVQATVIHTPGHTQGSVCLHVENADLLLAGDTLFAGSVGRSDLPGGNGAQLIRSIRERLLVLPEATVVIPGHGGLTQIGTEREENPFL